MNISYINTVKLTHSSENPLASFLNSSNQKIISLALLIFCGIALAFWAFARCGFRIIRIDPKKDDDNDRVAVVQKRQLATDPEEPLIENEKADGKFEQEKLDLKQIQEPDHKADKKSEDTKLTDDDDEKKVDGATQTFSMIDLGKGKSRKVFSNGLVEEGLFIKNKLEGTGLRRYPDKYDPQFQVDPEIVSLQGNFIDGNFVRGDVKFKDGRLFTGTMFGGQIAEGKMDYSSVAATTLLYEEGYFESNKLHGYGEACDKDGKKVNGYFFKGVKRDIHLEGGYPIHVKTLTGKSLPIHVEASDLVFDLKCKIEMLESLPILQCRLVFCGKQLEDDKPLSEYLIQRESTVHLVLKLSGD